MISTACAVGSVSLTGMELVRSLIEIRSSLGWTSLVAGSRTRPDLVLELHESEPTSAWFVFVEPDVDGNRLARMLAEAVPATLRLVRFELEHETMRGTISVVEVSPDATTHDLDEDESFNTELDADELPLDHARRMIINSLDLDDETYRATRLPYVRNAKPTRRRSGA